jgi:hypothetical protein
MKDRSPNPPAAGNAALGVCLHFGHRGRGVPEKV